MLSITVVSDPALVQSIIAPIRGDYATAGRWGEAAPSQGDYVAAQKYAHEAYAQARENGDDWFMAYCYNNGSRGPAAGRVTRLVKLGIPEGGKLWNKKYDFAPLPMACALPTQLWAAVRP